jgi:hypothetical protein
LRELREEEVAVLRWLLEHAAVGDVSDYRASASGELRARPCCDACAGLVFDELPRLSLTMLADALAVYPDGEVAGVLLHGYEGRLAWLELHDTMADGTAKRFPAVGDLRTWEEYGAMGSPAFRPGDSRPGGEET